MKFYKESAIYWIRLKYIFFTQPYNRHGNRGSVFLLYPIPPNQNSKSIFFVTFKVSLNDFFYSNYKF